MRNIITNFNLRTVKIILNFVVKQIKLFVLLFVVNV